MGENEKAIREALGWMKSRAGFGGTPAELKRAADAISGLDALLAEHRAEVAKLNAAVAAAVQAANLARDAALLEAEESNNTAFRECEKGTTTGTDFRKGMFYMHTTAQDRIRALESQPEPAAQARCECGHLLDVHHSRGGCAACGCTQYRPLLPSSQPARQYVDVERVREVLVDSMFHSLWKDGSGLTAEEKAHNETVREVMRSIEHVVCTTGLDGTDPEP